jgi:hypothetical protein
MIRALFLFLVLFGIFFLGIKGFIAMAGKEKLELTKTLLYSIVCSVAAMLVIVAIVVLF